MLHALLLFCVAQEPGQDAIDGLSESERRTLLAMAPAAKPPASPTNRWADDPAVAELGRALFFDPGLSAGGRMSCASCHDPKKCWCDGLPHPVGVKIGRAHV